MNRIVPVTPVADEPEEGVIDGRVDDRPVVATRGALVDDGRRGSGLRALLGDLDERLVDDLEMYSGDPRRWGTG